MDIGMPRLDGYEAARRIRNQDWSRETLLVAVTGWGPSDDSEEATAAGFACHFTKPPDPAELRRIISGVRPRLLADDPGLTSQSAVADAVDAFTARAMRAAIDRPVCLHAVADDGHAAAGTLRRQRPDRALEAIEDTPIAVRKQHRERLV